MAGILQMKKKKKKKRDNSLYYQCLHFTKIKFPKYKKASEKHKEIIDRILATKDFCLAMPDSKGRELLILELIDKVIGDIKDKKDFTNYVMISNKDMTIFGDKFSVCPRVDEISYDSDRSQDNAFRNDSDDIRLLIIDDINVDKIKDWNIKDINNLVSLLRQKNKDMKVLYIVNDLFTSNHIGFFRMFAILNLNVARLNHMIDVDNFISMFFERSKSGKGISYINLKILEEMLKKHLYIMPPEQVERMNFALAKVYEIENRNDLMQTILQNMLNLNEESKTYKHISGITPISDYSKYLNLIIDRAELLTTQTIDKKHYYYKKKDFRVYNENISTGRHTKSKYELHMVNFLMQHFVDKQKNHIRTIHLVVDISEDFLDTYLQAINLLYNGDFVDQVRLFIYFVAKEKGSGGYTEQFVSSFDFENTDSYRELLSQYQRMKANIKLRYDEDKTFEEIMNEILGESNST